MKYNVKVIVWYCVVSKDLWIEITEGYCFLMIDRTAESALGFEDGL